MSSTLLLSICRSALVNRCKAPHSADCSAQSLNDGFTVDSNHRSQKERPKQVGSRKIRVKRNLAVCNARCSGRRGMTCMGLQKDLQSLTVLQFLNLARKRHDHSFKQCWSFTVSWFTYLIIYVISIIFSQSVVNRLQIVSSHSLVRSGDWQMTQFCTQLRVNATRATFS